MTSLLNMNQKKGDNNNEVLVEENNAEVMKKEQRVFSNDDYDIQVFKEDPDVLRTALKHARTWSLYYEKSVVAQHTKLAFQAACGFVDSFYQQKYSNANNDMHSNNSSMPTKYIIIDSGCGVGLSSVKIARLNPSIPVIGLDRSFVRLSKSASNVYNSENMESSESPANLILLRAEISDFLLLILRERVEWVVRAHYLLYPNPYPKAKHLQRRWHGMFNHNIVCFF